MDASASERKPEAGEGGQVDALPLGYPAVTPHLVMSDCGRAVLFYRRALGAVELYRLRTRDGRIAHAELRIGDSRLTISDEAPEWGSKSARSYGGSPTVLRVYASNVEVVASRFVKAGGIIVTPLRNQFYGDLSGQFQDPEGYRWILAQRVENVAPEEMVRRMPNLSIG